MKEETDESGISAWSKIILAVKGPVGIMTLVALVLQSILGALAIRVSGNNQLILIIGMVGVLFLLVAGIIVLVYRNPELLGHRVVSQEDRKITGAWWQYVVNSDNGAVVSFITIKYLQPFCIWELKGKGWTREGEWIARFWSQAVAYDMKTRELFYYWKGEHPFNKSAEKYFGVGEIAFATHDDKAVSTAGGWYSASPSEKLDNTVKKSAIYVRGDEDDIKVVYGNNDDVLQNLLKKRVEEREKKCKQGAKYAENVG